MLALKSDFNLDDCFKVFDIDERGNINLRELEEAYNILGLYPQREELELVINKYDKDHDGKLDFSEFTNMVVPRDKNYASLILKRKSFNEGTAFPRDEAFTPETQHEFVSLLKMLGAAEIRAEQNRQSLKIRPSFYLS